MTVRTESAHRYPLPRAFLSVLALRHILTRCAHSQHFYLSSSDCQNHSMKSSLLTCLTCVRRKPHPRIGHPETNLLTCFRVLIPHCLAEWLFQKKKQVMSPTASFIWPESLFPSWTWHVTMKTHILTCSTFRCSFPRVQMLHQIILHWERSHKLKATSCGMIQVSIRCRLRRAYILGNYGIPRHTLRIHKQFWDLKKLFNCLHNEHEKVWLFSAKARNALLHQQW